MSTSINLQSDERSGKKNAHFVVRITLWSARLGSRSKLSIKRIPSSFLRGKVSVSFATTGVVKHDPHRRSVFGRHSARNWQIIENHRKPPNALLNKSVKKNYTIHRDCSKKKKPKFAANTVCGQRLFVRAWRCGVYVFFAVARAENYPRENSRTSKYRIGIANKALGRNRYRCRTN